MDIHEASQRLRKSQWTIRRLIKQGKLKASLVDGKYDIEEESVNAYLSEYESAYRNEMSVQTVNEQAMIRQIHSQVQSLEKEVDFLRTQLDKSQEELSETRKRSDTIILQLTRQFENNQKLLEDLRPKQRSLWKRLFGAGKEKKKESDLSERLSKGSAI